MKIICPFYHENLFNIRPPIWGVVVLIGRSSIASMKSNIDWRTMTRMSLRRGRSCSSTLPARQELKWGAKDGKLGVMTTQFPDHSNLSRMILTIATSDGNDKTAGRCLISSFGSISPTPQERLPHIMITASVIKARVQPFKPLQDDHRPVATSSDSHGN